MNSTTTAIQAIRSTLTQITLGLGLITGTVLNVSLAHAEAHLKYMHPKSDAIELRDAESARKSGNGSSASAQPSHLAYYGGSVLANVKIVSVIWGSAVDPATVSGIGGFYAAVTNSTYMDWLSEYDTTIHAIDGRQGTSQHIGRGSFLTQVQINPKKIKGKISDTQIRAELAAQIAANNLPAPDSNTLYMVHFPKTITITQGSGRAAATSCKQFCAYHNSFLNNSAQVNYGVLPDLGANGCQNGCGTLDTFSNLTVTASHELTEAITDSGVGLATGNGPSFPMGWYDQNNGEIGDICASTAGKIQNGKGVTYSVQGEWSNARNGCVTSATSQVLVLH